MMLFERNQNVLAGRRGKAKKRGFTLIELLVVIAVIAVLISMLLPALQNARTQAKMTICGVQLKQLGAIWISYADDYSDFYPPCTSWNSVWGFLHEEFDRRDVSDGKIFYCTDYEPGTWRTGTPVDWHHKDPDYDRYGVGYALFTTVLDFARDPHDPVHPEHSENIPWRAADGMPTSVPGEYRGLSWQYSYGYADSELRHIIPPWKASERSHWANCWSPTKFSIIPEESPMAFDMSVSESASAITSTALDITDDFWMFTKQSTRHFNAAQAIPTGINAVYMDGHVERRRGEDARILRYTGAPWFAAYWF